MSDTPTPTAIIDIGSNSVRMVVYHAQSRVPMPVFNEKYACQLGAHLSVTGKLNPDGVVMARKAIARFVTLARRMHVPDSAFQIIATAAARDATDGAAFAEEIEANHGLKVQVISGEEEAKLAAYGILSGMYRPRGIVADLGGGSLELAALGDGEKSEESAILAQHTMPLGVLRLHEEADGSLEMARDIVAQQLSKIDWLATHAQGTLYAVGGSFRALAKSYMESQHYPLPILQEYHMSADVLREWMRHLCVMDEAQLDALPGIPSKRAPLIPAACGAMEALLNRLGATQIVFSVSGVREGVLFRDLPDAERIKGPLIASAQYHAGLANRYGTYGHALYEWMRPLFPSLEDSRLRLAACLLSELAWTVDPNFRAEWVFSRVVQSSMKGLNHPQRIQLALALYYRYSRSWELGDDHPLFALVSEEERRTAQMIGLAMNLAFQISGGHSENLADVPLKVQEDAASIDFTNASASLDSAVVQKRLDGLGVMLSAFSSCDK